MIPKIIHQMWIGPKPPPIKLMNTWKEKNPDYEYILWNEGEIEKKNMRFTCQDEIETMSEINGKADIMRWEILYKYGGIFIDADSICIEPLTPLFHGCKGFASWENEKIRPGLLSTCCMGFVPRHEICAVAIDWIENNDVCVERTKQPAWVLTGPNLLTEIYKKKKYVGFSVFPSYFFSPIHYSGKLYLGHSKVYGLHVWGSTKQAYETMHTIHLPKFFEKPEKSISLLVYNENTKCLHVSEFLKSVTNQLGHFEIELIWLDNATDPFFTYAFKKELDHWLQHTRFITLVYKKMDPGTNMTNSLNKGLKLCSHDYVFHMDVNHVMAPSKIGIQLDYLIKHPECSIVGSNVRLFEEKKKTLTSVSHVPLKVCKKGEPFFTTTLAFRKDFWESLGGYKNNYDVLHLFAQGLEIHNVPDILVYLREINGTQIGIALGKT